MRQHQQQQQQQQKQQITRILLLLILVALLSSFDSISCFSTTITHTALLRRSSVFASTLVDGSGRQLLQQQKQKQRRSSSSSYDSRTSSTAKRMSSTTENENENTNDEKLLELKFHEIVERDQKEIPIVSSSALALKLFVVVPIWITVVVPLTITYQIGKAIVARIDSLRIKKEGEEDNHDAVVTSTTTEKEEKEEPLLIVDPKYVIPRKERKYDVVMLGATGFTGGLAVRHLAKTYYNYNNNDGNNGNNNKVGSSTIKWAIAGRSEFKLKQVLEKLAMELNIPNLVNDIDIIICDTSDENQSTLKELVYNTKSIATTVGPFSIYGENVIKYCVHYGTHYTDITGETSFVKLMKSKYQYVAQRTGSRIFNFSGNDCVPWDLSYNLLADEFSGASFGDNESLEKIEFINEFSSSASGGTLKTMCMGIDGRLAKPLPKDDTILRRNGVIDHDLPMENKISFGIERGVQKPWKMTSEYNNNNNNNNNANNKIITAPFVMSGVNYEAISWSHALRKDPICSYKEQLVQPDLKTALDGVFGLTIFFTSLMNPITGKLLEKFVITKPGDGPTMEDMTNKYFLAVTSTAYGSKGTILQSLLYYNKDPGYLETARMVIECSLCLATSFVDNDNGNDDNGKEENNDDNDKTQTQITGGGFYSPGFALRKVLLKRLVDTGCYYELRVIQEAAAAAAEKEKETAELTSSSGSS